MPRKSALSAKKAKKPTEKKTTQTTKKATSTPTPKTGPKRVTKNDYIFAVGRRKSAVARVRYYCKRENSVVVNNKEMKVYFPTATLQNIVLSPISQTKMNGRFSIFVLGGGKRGQAEATRLGITRAIIKREPDLRKQVKALGFLTRDARVKERKKYGLKRARRAPQWQKR